MTRSKYKKWLREEELVISKLRKEGLTTKEIAKQLNRSITSVSSRITQMIGRCELEKKSTKHKAIDYDKVGEYVSKNPGNIQEAFRQYAKDYGFSVNSIHYAYYSKKQKKRRIKDGKALIVVVGSNGHTINGKNTEEVYKSTLWQTVVYWVKKVLKS